MNEILYKRVKPKGKTCGYIYLPKNLVGKEVVITEVKNDN